MDNVQFAFKFGRFAKNQEFKARMNQFLHEGDPFEPYQFQRPSIVTQNRCHPLRSTFSDEIYLFDSPDDLAVWHHFIQICYPVDTCFVNIPEWEMKEQILKRTYPQLFFKQGSPFLAYAFEVLYRCGEDVVRLHFLK